MRQPPVVDAEAVQDRGVEFMIMYRIADDIVAEVVILAPSYASGDPHAKTTRMMIASVSVAPELALRIDCAAESAAPHNQRFDRGGFHFVVLDACFRSDGVPYGRKNFKWTDTKIPPAERK